MKLIVPSLLIVATRRPALVFSRCCFTASSFCMMHQVPLDLYNCSYVYKSHSSSRIYHMSEHGRCLDAHLVSMDNRDDPPVSIPVLLFTGCALLNFRWNDFEGGSLGIDHNQKWKGPPGPAVRRHEPHPHRGTVSRLPQAYGHR